MVEASSCQVNGGVIIDRNPIINTIELEGIKSIECPGGQSWA